MQYMPTELIGPPMVDMNARASFIWLLFVCVSIDLLLVPVRRNFCVGTGARSKDNGWRSEWSSNRTAADFMQVGWVIFEKNGFSIHSICSSFQAPSRSRLSAAIKLIIVILISLNFTKKMSIRVIILQFFK